MNIIRKAGSFVALVACFGTLGACEDFLEIEQTVEPASRTIFDSDEDFEAALGSTFGVWWGTAQGSRPTNSVQNWPVLAMANLGDELVMSLTTSTGHAYVAQEPRVAYDNDQFGGNWLFRKPFYDMYQCIATSVDAIQYLRANPTRKIMNGEVDMTLRAKWFARLMIGTCHVYAGLLFDQAYMIDDTFDTQNPNQDFASMLTPHPQVTAFGIAELEKAIAEMEADPANPEIPVTWINRDAGSLVTKNELIGFAHSMIARALIYDARTPQQRAAADWDRAVSHIEQGITEDFWVRGLSPRFDSRYKQYINFSNDGRISNRIVGPADTTGAYEAWEAAGLNGRDHFLIRTRDRRVHGPDVYNTATPPVLTLAGYKNPGAYFRLRYSNCSSSQLATRGPAAVFWNPVNASSSGGTYRRTLYASNKWEGGADHYDEGELVTMSVAEMNFLRAEALLRDGDADGAADIINAQSRVSIGKLPPATAAGSGTLPACVPRKLFATTPTCGSIWDVLMYEKRMETHGTEAIIPFADWRGWGMMPEGTICQFAPPYRELELFGVEYYTFGGSWPGSVGQPARPNGATCGAALDVGTSGGPLGTGTW